MSLTEKRKAARETAGAAVMLGVLDSGTFNGKRWQVVDVDDCWTTVVWDGVLSARYDNRDPILRALAPAPAVPAVAAKDNGCTSFSGTVRCDKGEGHYGDHRCGGFVWSLSTFSIPTVGPMRSASWVQVGSPPAPTVPDERRQKLNQAKAELHYFNAGEAPARSAVFLVIEVLESLLEQPSSPLGEQE